MHFHLFDADEEALRLGELLCDEFADVLVDDRPERHVPRAYLAAYRYIVAAQHMLETASPVFVFDIDVGFRQSLEAFVEASGLDVNKIAVRRSPLLLRPSRR